MSSNYSKTKHTDLVLVGGGHTHVQVLRSFAMQPPPNIRLTIVLDTPLAVYSGMVPGFVADQYSAEELEINVLPLARRAQARVILARAEAVDPEERQIQLQDRPGIPYTLASFDIGSTVGGLDLPGIRQHTLPTRPIGRFVRRFARLTETTEKVGKGTLDKVLIVGAGAGGVELAFALAQRLGKTNLESRITLLQAGDEILPGYPGGMRQRVQQAAKAKGINIRTRARVAEATAKGILLTDGESLDADLIVWVTGAVGQDVFRNSGLAVDSRGFAHTRSTLQIEGYDDLFAVGDCATLRQFPETPKAGVYAVRQGPYLIHNLRAKLAGRALKSYRPQKDFLVLLNLGDGSAIGNKWGRSFEGKWVMDLKDHIDRKFMRRFQVLDTRASLSSEFPDMGDEMNMLCGGCAAKVGQSVLQQALARLSPQPPNSDVVLGLERPDDAAACRLRNGDLLVSTVDMFRAFTDDPYLVGKVAAVNAASDLLAKGVQPAHALALVAIPEEVEAEAAGEILYQALSGARAAFDSMGVTLLGGHTTTATGLMVGFSINGIATADTPLLALDQLQTGQVLILSKALGTGVLFHADMQGRARGPWIETAIASMLRPNADAARIARHWGATAATDITGFGLAGHVSELLRASGLAASLDLGRLPALPGALPLFAQGLRSTFHPENARARRGIAIPASAAGRLELELLFDPQTSGGLVFGLPEENAQQALVDLRQAGDQAAAIIGRVIAPRPDGAPLEIHP